MKNATAYLFLALCIALCINASTVSWAEESAIEQLLNIFSQKGMLSTQEATKLREAIRRDKEELEALKQKLDGEKKELTQWEQDLRAREQALAAQEHHPIAASAPPEEKQDHGGQSTRAMSGEPGSIPLKAVFDDGFYLTTGEDGAFSLRFGGLLQTDYRFYDYDCQDPGKNKFDVRRARLRLSGDITRHVGFKFEYDFEGVGSRHLLDAYVDLHLLDTVSLRIGQFKEPFSFEQYTKDEDWLFTERSMGYYLTPRRDVGVMVYSSLWNDRINYAAGVFNGDGPDDTTSGDQDDPQMTGRAVFAPFKGRGIPWGENLQIGGSFSYSHIDPSNVQVQVQTSGLTTFFDVASGAKFNIIRDVDDRQRYGAELAWAYGPLVLSAEYFNLRYDNISTSASEFDTELEDYYVALLWMVTGERPEIKNGILQPIRPRQSLWNGGWGALGLAFRFDSFEANESVYDDLIMKGNSVREAEAYSFCVRWYLTDFALVMLNATRTRFDTDLLVGRDPLEGTAMYSDVEDVLAARFQLGF